MQGGPTTHSGTKGVEGSDLTEDKCPPESVIYIMGPMGAIKPHPPETPTTSTQPQQVQREIWHAAQPPLPPRAGARDGLDPRRSDAAPI